MYKGNTNRLKKKIKNLPESPGVYLFYDKQGKIIYIGKAKNLKKRVASYFTKQKFDSFKVKVLVNRIQAIDHIVVNNESDALLLENNLIKKHQPRYNVLLKDDKTFPWICIKNESFPRVFSTRNITRDGSTYFGPYTSAYMVRTLLNLIRQLYQLRTCKLALNEENIKAKKFRVCLEYHIGNCKGPCEGLQNEQDYRETIDQIKLILKGNLNELMNYLKKEMQKKADEFRFEEANSFKEKIEIISRYKSKSTIVNPAITNVDVFTIINDEKEAFVNYIKVDKGSVTQAHTVEIRKKLDESPEDLLAFAITDIRERTQSTAREIVVPIDMKDIFPDLKITVPKRGDRKKLTDLSLRNAKAFKLERKKDKTATMPLRSNERLMQKLKTDLRMKKLPVRIECFDNSNLQGSSPVAACVVFKNAKPAKNEYRHYNIKNVSGPDDYASMEEVVYRRYKRLLEEQGDLPQLIIIDGGKGQLNAALKSLERLDLRGQISVIGIAKKLEEIYFPEDPVPLYIDKNSESLKLIQHLRNEAHRFGINFHRRKRSSRFTDSILKNIEGIGDKSREKLLIHFKSTNAVFDAPPDEVAKIVGVAKARKIKQYLAENPEITSSWKQ
jgi:excinuclease ABC subunit C